MFSRYFFPSALLIVGLSAALTQRVTLSLAHDSVSHSARARRPQPKNQATRNPRFTVQVAAFSDETKANKLIAHLIERGLQPTQGTLELPGRSRWIQVFVGSFASQKAARRYGQNLIARGIIKSFLVKAAASLNILGRRSVSHLVGSTSPPGAESIRVKPSFHTDWAVQLAPKPRGAIDFPVRPLALNKVVIVDVGPLPWPDPVEIAFSQFAGRNNSGRGGLWLTGDIDEGLARLRWIAGPDARLISIDRTGRVILDKQLLAKAVGSNQARAGAALRAANYISSNEGLKLLVQLTQGPHRYQLHIGNRAQTAEGEVEIEASINLDNNYDSRINPYRRGGKKLGRELPPEGFDSLVAINPTARWFNLRTGRLVPPGCITFHELAEAYAKVQLGLEYLPREAKPGAHNLALERELKLQTERSAMDVVVTAGSNRVLRSERELRRFSQELQSKSSFKD
jgi:hypothetical protein